MKKDSEQNRRIEILTKKMDLFQELLDITKKQTQWIENKDWDRLNNAINAKQTRIDKIDSLNILFNRITQAENDVKTIEQIEDMNREIELIGKEIVEIEQSNIKKVNQAKKLIKMELKEIQAQKKINTAYSDESLNDQGGQYIDKLK
ncbi:MAG: flagellar protein FlgN [Clostridiales bacterium]|nr:flagellar protein FlgN [Clostridiales bacterium]